MDDYEEQVDKFKYYNQQGGGGARRPEVEGHDDDIDEIDYDIYHRLPRQRGSGSISSLAQRFAYPVFRSLMTYARPLMKGVFTEAKTVARDAIKDAAVKKLEDLTTRLKSPETPTQLGNGHDQQLISSADLDPATTIG